MNEFKRKILLVEDDFLIAAAEKLILTNYNFDVIHAFSGENCLEILKNNSDIDLILMDIDLGGGMDGIDTSILISRKFDIPIIFLSSHTEPEIIQKTEKITSYGYIVKNSGETVLIASINMAFRLKKSNEQIRLTFENSKEAIILADDDGKFIKINQAAMELLELNPDTYQNFKVSDLKILGDVKPEIRYQKYIQKGQENGIIEIQLSNGEKRIAEYNAFQIAPNLHQSILRDKTIEIQSSLELEKALEEKTILMKELQHRVRNSFTMISSLINLEKENKHNEETIQVLSDLDGRINSLTKLYELLLKSENNTIVSLNEYITYITESINNSFSKKMDRIKIVLDLDNCQVNSREATSWGLITNELITNAMKYAFPINQNGIIYVSLKERENLIELEVSDTGRGPDKDFSLSENTFIGLGLTLVNLLSKQLHGKIEYSRTDRTNFKVICSRFSK
ncbi:MAG: response regulator [Leptospira sp.]|nr:response regulator [Leptospira sp.]